MKFMATAYTDILTPVVREFEWEDYTTYKEIKDLYAKAVELISESVPKDERSVLYAHSVLVWREKNIYQGLGGWCPILRPE